MEVSPFTAGRRSGEELRSSEYPLTFTEYLLLKKGIRIPEKLNIALKHALLNCDFSGIEEKLEGILLKFTERDVEDYLIQGSLPIYLTSTSPLEDAYEIVRKIVEIDLVREGLSETTREKALGLLLLLASGESLAYDDLSSTLGLAKGTVEKLIEKLEDLEVIFPVRAYGSLGKVARKTPKYKFLAPMLRSAVLYEFGLFERDSKTLGMLLEDAVALYLHLLVREKKMGLHYDAQKGGADFILKGHSIGIVIEAGWGKKDLRGPLKKKGDVWFVPRELFLLML
ncbi:DUF4143 domain-containing protein [Thermococcus barophilus]|uniref:DUF4143 domain-containing protein n=1 Tax=Thermococcus barophilus TaxID=55802 RepID=A0A0S1X8E5_THEBA|nr:hypothetical protein [Thermococcus barophilus]ALM74067.1 hypothetical protein TBCH5v1_0088 [Thermococcus barophilus]